MHLTLLGTIYGLSSLYYICNFLRECVVKKSSNVHIIVWWQIYMIPKIIHQIWVGPKKEPVKWTNTIKIDYIRKYPEYEYKLWNESNIDELFTDFPNIKIIYNLEKTWHGKADILRYLILYYYGGIYIDADSVWINDKNFDELIDNSCGFFVCNEPNKELLLAIGVIGTYKTNPVFLSILNHISSYIVSKSGVIKPKYYINKRIEYGVCATTGPIIFNRYVKNVPITIFPTHYFYPITWHGITDSDYHLKIELPKDSFLFQYGYTTNSLDV
jgi:inositol phosphorylceramide mannosyltransferase catalytic subunit